MLGGVFLCITGAEALYADMGHLGRGPIRRSWYCIVLPALLLSYAGQTALLIEKQTVTRQSFFPARTRLGGLSAGGAGYARDGDCEPGHHHGLVLNDPAGHATRLASRCQHPADLG